MTARLLVRIVIVTPLTLVRTASSLDAVGAPVACLEFLAWEPR